MGSEARILKFKVLQYDVEYHMQCLKLILNEPLKLNVTL